MKFFKISIRTILKKAKNIYIISGGLAYRTVEVIKNYMYVCNYEIYQATAPFMDLTAVILSYKPSANASIL